MLHKRVAVYMELDRATQACGRLHGSRPCYTSVWPFTWSYTVLHKRVAVYMELDRATQACGRLHGARPCYTRGRHGH